MDRINNYLIFDFETGGLDAERNPAVEFAGVLIDGVTLEEIDRYESIISPYNDFLKYDPKALEICGISMSEINNGVDVYQVANNIVSLLERGNSSKKNGSKVILVGHNVYFDFSFLRSIFLFTEKSTYLYDNIEGYKIHGVKEMYPYCLDTMYLSKLKYGNKDSKILNYKLNTVCSESGIDLVDAHRAMRDVIATKELFCKYVGNMRLDSVESGEVSNFRKQFQF